LPAIHCLTTTKPTKRETSSHYAKITQTKLATTAREQCQRPSHNVIDCCL